MTGSEREPIFSLSVIKHEDGSADIHINTAAGIENLVDLRNAIRDARTALDVWMTYTPAELEKIVMSKQ